MKITFDPAKRAATLQLRSLDFADASLVFAGLTMDVADSHQDYGEPRGADDRLSRLMPDAAG